MPNCRQASICLARAEGRLSVNVGVSVGLQETTLLFALIVQIGFLALIGLKFRWLKKNRGGRRYRSILGHSFPPFVVSSRTLSDCFGDTEQLNELLEAFADYKVITFGLHLTVPSDTECGLLPVLIGNDKANVYG